MRPGDHDRQGRALRRLGVRGLAALMILFLAYYPGVFAAVLFARALNGGDYPEANVALGLVFALAIRGWRNWILSLLSDALFDWILGQDIERR